MTQGDDQSQRSALPAGPPGAVARLARHLAAGLPHTQLGRYGASLLLRLAGGRKRRGYDVSVFGNEQARLYPFDNICEKRVYITPQFCDREERIILRAFIEERPGNAFVFLDIGANAGLYSLFVRSVCKQERRPATIVAVEPDPYMVARLSHNLDAAADGAGSHTVLPWAIAAESGPLYLHANDANRGMTAVSHEAMDGAPGVDGHPLIDILAETGITRIDALKMDIEGGEYEALKSFFDVATQDQLPALLILETSHEDDLKSIVALCNEAGYELVFRNWLNSILRRKS